RRRRVRRYRRCRLRAQADPVRFGKCVRRRQPHHHRAGAKGRELALCARRTGLARSQGKHRYGVARGDQRGGHPTREPLRYVTAEGNPMSKLRTILPGAVVVAMSGFAPSAFAQAPGSAFGQSPQQLQQHLERPPAQLPPAKPLAKPATNAPNWNAVGSGTAPSSLPPPPAASAVPHPVQTLKPGAPAKTARMMPLAKEKLTKLAPERA